MLRFKFLFCLLLLACSIPKNEELGNDFVPSFELAVNILTKQGEAKFNNFQFMDALNQFEKAYELAPKAKPTRLNLAITYIQLGEFNQALQILRELEVEFPDDFIVKFSLANALFSNMNYKESENVFKNILKVSLEEKKYTDASLALMSLADLFYAQGLVDEALCKSLEAVSYNQDRIQYLFYINLLLRIGYTIKAKEFIESKFSSFDIQNDDEINYLYKKIITPN